MLTNKQLWRKQKQLFPGMNLRRILSDETIVAGFTNSLDSSVDSENDGNIRPSESSLDCSSPCVSPESLIKCSDSVEQLNIPAPTLEKIRKRIRFDSMVRVTLIPSINEYKDAGLHLFLWCSQNELQCYKDSAYQDIKDYMLANNCNDFAQAMKTLFQLQSVAEV